MNPGRFFVFIFLCCILVLWEGFVLVAGVYMCAKLGMCRELVAKLRDVPEQTEAEQRANIVFFLVFWGAQFFGVWWILEEDYRAQKRRRNPPNPNIVIV